jgi:hypothetical protein
MVSGRIQVVTSSAGGSPGYRLRSIAVSVAPRHSSFTRMWWRRRARDHASDRPRSAHLEAS